MSTKIFDLAVDREFDVIGFGTNAVDFLIGVPVYPKFDSKVEISGYTQLAGGEIATAMVGLQRLGLKTAYSGAFGDDSAGEFGLRSLIDEGVNVEFSKTVNGALTQIAFIIIDDRTGERTVLWKRDSKLAFSPDEITPEFAAKGKFLHLTPHDSAACLKLAKAARQAGTIVSIDLDNIFPGTEELLYFVDVFMMSAELPKRLVGESDAHKALEIIQSRYGCKIAGITQGESGSLILMDGKFVKTDGYAVPGGCKDTTGAGDSFRAGLIYGIVTGQDLETSAKIANAVAALKCRRIGARTALPTLDEVKELTGI